MQFRTWAIYVDQGIWGKNGMARWIYVPPFTSPPPRQQGETLDYYDTNLSNLRPEFKVSHNYFDELLGLNF